VGATVEAFAPLPREDSERYGKLTQAAGIVPEQSREDTG
jgi:hypothetical protein